MSSHQNPLSCSRDINKYFVSLAFTSRQITLLEREREKKKDTFPKDIQLKIYHTSVGIVEINTEKTFSFVHKTLPLYQRNIRVYTDKVSYRCKVLILQNKSLKKRKRNKSIPSTRFCCSPA
jgi:hypothetical protein